MNDLVRSMSLEQLGDIRDNRYTARFDQESNVTRVELGDYLLSAKSIHPSRQISIGKSVVSKRSAFNK